MNTLGQVLILSAENILTRRVDSYSTVCICSFSLCLLNWALTSPCGSHEGNAARSRVCAGAPQAFWSADCEWDALLKDLWVETLLLSALCMGSSDCLVDSRCVDETLKPRNSSVRTENTGYWRRDRVRLQCKQARVSSKARAEYTPVIAWYGVLCCPSHGFIRRSSTSHTGSAAVLNRVVFLYLIKRPSIYCFLYSTGHMTANQETWKHGCCAVLLMQSASSVQLTTL